KTRSRLREKFEQGQVAGAKVYGYDNVRHGPVGKGGYSTRAINAEQEAIVKRIFRMYTTDLQGAPVIASTLNRAGVPSPRKGGWQGEGITYMLCNEAYTGRSRFQSQRPESQEEGGVDTLTREDESLRIISDEVFKAAQAVRQGRKPAPDLPRAG